MNTNYIDAEVFPPTSPAGLDLKILEIQQALSSIPWLQKVFGRATAQRSKRISPGEQKPREIVYPEVYQANNEPMEIMPNDNFASYCFFVSNDPGEFVDYDSSDEQILMSRPISIIFWINQDKTNPGERGRMNENYIIDVTRVLRNFPEFKPTQVNERYDHVFQEFTITDQYKEFMKLPFTAFRISGEITYPTISENIC